MKARAIETAREAMSQIKVQIDKMAESPDFVNDYSETMMAWYRVRNFIDIVEKESKANEKI